VRTRTKAEDYTTDGPDIYNSIISNLYSVYHLDYETNCVYYFNVSHVFRNSSIVEDINVYNFHGSKCFESIGQLSDRIVPPNFQDTLLNHNSYNPIKSIQINNLKKVGTKKINNNLRPSILMVLHGLFKYVKCDDL